MKIFPRVIDVAGTGESCAFHLKNSSKDKVILFKIKRSDPKVLDFAPKRGLVEPGATKSITACLVQNVAVGKILVKMVAVKKHRLHENFEENWEQGSQKCVVKKIVSIRNRSVNDNLVDELSISAVSDEMGGTLLSGRMSPQSWSKGSRALRQGSPGSMNDEPSVDESDTGANIDTMDTRSEAGESNFSFGAESFASSLFSSSMSPRGLLVRQKVVGYPQPQHDQSIGISHSSQNDSKTQSLLSAIEKLLPAGTSAADGSLSSILIGVGMGLGMKLNQSSSSLVLDAEDSSSGKDRDAEIRNSGRTITTGTGTGTTGSSTIIGLVGGKVGRAALKGVTKNEQLLRSFIIDQSAGDNDADSTSSGTPGAGTTVAATGINRGLRKLQSALRQPVSPSSVVLGGGMEAIEEEEGGVSTDVSILQHHDNDEEVPHSHGGADAEAEEEYKDTHENACSSSASLSLSLLAPASPSRIPVKPGSSRPMNTKKLVHTTNANNRSSSSASTSATAGAAVVGASQPNTQQHINSGKSAKNIKQQSKPSVAVSTGAAAVKYAEQEFSVPATKTVEECSSLRAATSSSSNKDIKVTSSSRVGASDNKLVIEISGTSATDRIVTQAVEMRLEESVRTRKKVHAIEMHDCPIHTVADSVAAAFSVVLDSEGKEGSGGGYSEDALRSKETMAFILEDNLRILTISSTTLSSLDFSINRFTKLTTLELGNNKINAIIGQLDLPSLTRLDLSNNLLSELDYLQGLHSLKTLNVSNNRIASLKSVHTLVPQAVSMRRIDLSSNPVCTDGRYCETVLSILPYLKFFDNKDLQFMQQMVYSSALTNSHSHYNGKKKSSASHSTSSFSYFPSSSSGKKRNKKTYKRGGGSGSVVPPALPYESYLAAAFSKDQVEDVSKNDPDRVFESRLMRVLKRRTRAGILTTGGVGIRSLKLKEEKEDSDYDDIFSEKEDEEGEEEDDDSSGGGYENEEEEEEKNIEAFLLSTASASVHNSSKRHRKFDRTDTSYSSSLNRSTAAANLTTTQSSFTGARAAAAAGYGSSSAAAAKASAVTAGGTAIRSAASANAIPPQQLADEETDASNARTEGNRPKTSSKAIDSSQPLPNFMAPTDNARYRDKDLEPSIIAHWRGHEDQATLSQELLERQQQQTIWKPSSSSLSAPTLTPMPAPLSVGGRAAGTGTSTAGTPPAAAGTGRRRSWDGSSLASTKTSKSNRSGLLSTSTNLSFLRRKSWGLPLTEDVVPDGDLQRDGYFSDGGCAPSRRSSRIGSYHNTLSATKFKEAQEQLRFSIWHPRYRIPRQDFGFSFPFKDRPAPKPKKKPPLFDKEVQRMRNAFEKLPIRGTFSRGPRGLPPEWYPMEYTDAEIVCRSGYFSDAIGGLPLAQRDIDLKGQGVGMMSTFKDIHGTVSPNGRRARSVSPSHTADGMWTVQDLVPPGRRRNVESHQSRYLRSPLGVNDRQYAKPVDDFTDFRKWYPDIEPILNQNQNQTAMMNQSMASINSTVSMLSGLKSVNSATGVPKKSLSLANTLDDFLAIQSTLAGAGGGAQDSNVRRTDDFAFPTSADDSIAGFPSAYYRRQEEGGVALSSDWPAGGLAQQLPTAGIFGNPVIEKTLASIEAVTEQALVQLQRSGSPRSSTASLPGPQTSLLPAAVGLGSSSLAKLFSASNEADLVYHAIGTGSEGEDIDAFPSYAPPGFSTTATQRPALSINTDNITAVDSSSSSVQSITPQGPHSDIVGGPSQSPKKLLVVDHSTSTRGDDVRSRVFFSDEADSPLPLEIPFTAATTDSSSSATSFDVDPSTKTTDDDINPSSSSGGLKSPKSPTSPKPNTEPQSILKSKSDTKKAPSSSSASSLADDGESRVRSRSPSPPPKKDDLNKAVKVDVHPEEDQLTAYLHWLDLQQADTGDDVLRSSTSLAAAKDADKETLRGFGTPPKHRGYLPSRIPTAIRSRNSSPTEGDSRILQKEDDLAPAHHPRYSAAKPEQVSMTPEYDANPLKKLLGPPKIEDLGITYD